MKATPYILYAFRTFDVVAINRETSRIYSNKMGFQYIPNVSSDVKYIRLIRRSVIFNALLAFFSNRMEHSFLKLLFLFIVTVK